MFVCLFSFWLKRRIARALAMSASLQAAASLLEKFKSCASSEPLDRKKCEEMLSELKVIPEMLLLSSSTRLRQGREK